jgi:hypothetical protein
MACLFGIVHMAPKKYIEKMMMGYEQMFGEKLSTKVHSPLEKGDHPELDTSELLDQTECSRINCLLDPCNGLFCLVDLTTAVMSLSSLRALPC